MPRGRIGPICAFLGLTASLLAGWRCTAAAIVGHDPTPAGREIRLDGAVRSIDTTHSNLIMNVTSVTLPNGKPTSLAPARSKTIVFTVATRLTDWHGSRLALPDLKAGASAIVVGKDGGIGGSLTARVMVVDRSAPTVTAPAVDAAAVRGTPENLLAGYRALKWDAKRQGGFVTSMCRDLQGRVYFGMEDTGVWRYDAIAGWTHFQIKDGLGDDNAYALACDRLGRIWVGHLNHGVSVYSGSGWRNYDVLTGPLGPRIFAISTCPKDGDVWISSDAGIARYSLSQNNWSYFTRAEGLPSNQANAIAFDAAGNVFVASQCDGIAMAKAVEKYAKWTVVSGPDRMPNTSYGKGLPTNLINCLLVTRKGTIYAGTTIGLAKSEDDGRTWSYVRGKDWRAKVLGRYHGAPPVDGLGSQPLLAEDYVTALAEGEDGCLWVGYRQKGLEVLDLATGKVAAAFRDDYVNCVLPVSRRECVIGMYGGAVGYEKLPATAADVRFSSGSGEDRIDRPAGVGTGDRVSMPTPAAAPSRQQLAEMARKVADAPAGSISPIFMGDDWETGGDWVGRYGRKAAVLCAARSPVDHNIISDPAFRIGGCVGPHHLAADAMRHWVHFIKTDQQRCLYDPIPGYRRQSEWDDHGETYPSTFEGPDVWVAISVPDGVHRVSLYFVNKDGHDGPNRIRDYTLEVKPFSESLEVASESPTLARARVRDFWSGVYKQFAVHGPGKFWIRISKGGSQNAIISGVMLDQLFGPVRGGQRRALAWMGGVRYDPPAEGAGPDAGPQMAVRPGDEALREARLLWYVLEGSYAGLKVMRTYGTLAYRAAAACGTNAGPGPRWRWQLGFWEPEDRAVFDAVMKQAHDSLLEHFPQMVGKEY